VPPGISLVKVNLKTGKLADGEGSGVILEAFKQGTEPQPDSSAPGVSLFGSVPLVTEDETGAFEDGVLDGGGPVPPGMMDPANDNQSADGLRGPDGETLPFAVAVPEGGVPTDRIPGTGGEERERPGGVAAGGGQDGDIGAGTGGLY
jgi:hypothetical protein